MMTGCAAPADLPPASLESSPRVVLTVRLYGRAHEILIQEFAGLARRRRAARAVQLMLVGLLCERASLRGGPIAGGFALPSALPAASGPDIRFEPEADAFISGILCGPGNPETSEHRNGGTPDHSVAREPP